jgi:chromosome segregation ATPase
MNEEGSRHEDAIKRVEENLEFSAEEIKGTIEAVETELEEHINQSVAELRANIATDFDLRPDGTEDIEASILEMQGSLESLEATMEDLAVKVEELRNLLVEEVQEIKDAIDDLEADA